MPLTTNGYSGGLSGVTGLGLGSRAPEAKAINSGFRVDSLRLSRRTTPPIGDCWLCSADGQTSVMQYRIFQVHFKLSCPGLLVCFISVKCICFPGSASYPFPLPLGKYTMLLRVLRHRCWISPLIVILMLDSLARKSHTTILRNRARFSATKCIKLASWATLGGAYDTPPELLVVR